MKISDRVKMLQPLLLILAAVILTACGNIATPEPTTDVNALGTAAVETISANYTETALANPTNTPEPQNTPLPVITEAPGQVMVLPTMPGGESDMIINRQNLPQMPDTNAEALPEPPANIVLPILPTSAGPVAIIPTATLPAPSGGDKASWEGQSPADNTHIEAGAEFDMTWYLRNTGTTTWTTDYCLRYFSNTNLSKRPGQRFYLQKNVAPNELAECTIDAIAPTTPGTYKMAYVLSNAEDRNFYTVDITIIVD